MLCDTCLNMHNISYHYSQVICSDKTGTITQNRMSLSHVWMLNREEAQEQQAEDETMRSESSPSEQVMAVVEATPSKAPGSKTASRRQSMAPPTPLLAFGSSPRTHCGAIDMLSIDNNEASQWLKFDLSLLALCNSATIDADGKHIQVKYSSIHNNSNLVSFFVVLLFNPLYWTDRAHQRRAHCLAAPQISCVFWTCARGSRLPRRCRSTRRANTWWRCMNAIRWCFPGSCHRSSTKRVSR